MANEVTWAVVEGILGYDYRLLEESIIDALYAHNNALKFTWQKSIAGFPSESERFPQLPQLAAAPLTDGVDMTNTPFTPTQVTLSVGEVGLKLTITDLSRLSSLMDIQAYGNECGKAVAEKLTTDICALFAGFSNVSGTTAMVLLEADILNAVTALNTRSVPHPYMGMLHPAQWEDLITDVGTTIGAAGNTGATSRFETNDQIIEADGGLGQLYGVEWSTNPLIPTANAGADRAGGIVSAKALGYVEKWAIRSEVERDASLRGSEVVVTAAYAVGELADDRGQAVITDA